MLANRDQEIIASLQDTATAIAVLFLLLALAFLELAYFPGANRHTPSIAYAIGFVAFWGLLFEIKNRADQYIFKIFSKEPEKNTVPKVAGWAAILARILLWLLAGFAVTYPAIYYRSGLEVTNSIGFLIISIGLANLAYHRAKPFLPHP